LFCQEPSPLTGTSGISVRPIVMSCRIIYKGIPVLLMAGISRLNSTVEMQTTGLKNVGTLIGRERETMIRFGEQWQNSILDKVKE
jgi:hypothetical protein